ncbi:MAG TPA: hypothetical protein DCR35_10095 [Runella sp.]|nr:hypothetical protein [Runella sp.]
MRYGKELKVLGYYAFTFLILFTVDDIFPNEAGVHGPGLGFLLFFFLMLGSVGLIIHHLFAFLAGKNNYGRCLLIHLMVWAGLFVFTHLGT